jgi:hypothetical protein
MANSSKAAITVDVRAEATSRPSHGYLRSGTTRRTRPGRAGVARVAFWQLVLSAVLLALGQRRSGFFHDEGRSTTGSRRSRSASTAHRQAAAN